MPPAGAAVWRFIIAALFLVPVASYRERWDWRALRANFPALLFLGVVGISGFQLGMFYGLESSSAINASLIMAMGPALTVLFAAVLDRHNMDLQQWCGLGLGISGVLVVTTRGDIEVLRALRFNRGDLILLLGATAWALYSVVLKRYVRGLSLLQLAASTILICALSMAVGVALAAPAQLAWPPAAAWPALLFTGVVGSGFAYLWWNAAVVQIGAPRAAAFGNLVPVFTVAVGLALGQPIGLMQLLGAALVVGGVIMATATRVPSPGG
jgi:drug/metabolite transporter (DMT)-like permease